MTRVKNALLMLVYRLWFAIWKIAIYSRQPFPKYPYMFTPAELMQVAGLLLETDASGSVVEIGSNQGWSTAFLAEALREAGVRRDYFCLDTFEGFLAEDMEFEYAERKKTGSQYEDYFGVNSKRFFDYSMHRAGFDNVRSFKADASAFDYSICRPIAFCLVDVDLYLPVLRSLRAAMPHMAPGGLVVVDDCREDGPWDGARQAYLEYCEEIGATPEIICNKLGVIRVPA